MSLIFAAHKKNTGRSLSFKQIKKNKIKIDAYLFFSKKNDMYLCTPVKKRSLIERIYKGLQHKIHAIKCGEITGKNDK